MQACSSRGPGRPRLFDENDALDGAVELFSRVGFSAAAISDLVRATGLSVGSLYKAYQDKEGVFAKALARYVLVRDARLVETLEGLGKGRDRIRAVLQLYAALSQGESGRLGCMIVAGITELDLVGLEAAALIRSTLERRRALLEHLVAAAQVDRSATSTVKSALIADFLLNLVQGMRVVGKGGLFTKDEDALIELALNVLD